MNIQPLWIICLLVRFILLPLFLYIYIHTDVSRKIMSVILLLIGLGFIYKYITGSNDEVQIGKVFWHETRIVHGILYILSSYFLYTNNPAMAIIVLLVDPVFSIIYRVYTNQ